MLQRLKHLFSTSIRFRLTLGIALIQILTMSLFALSITWYQHHFLELSHELTHATYLQLLEKMAGGILLFILVTVLIGTGLVAMFSHHLTVRLSYLLDAMQEIRGGQRHLRVDASGKDEIAQLGDSFNLMIDTLSIREVELQNTRERLMLAMRGSNDGLWDWDLQTGRVFYSTRWKRMLGYRDYEIHDTLDEWRKRIHPEDRELAQQNLDWHLQGESLQYESIYRLHHKAGHYLWVLSRGVALRDEESNAIRMVGTHTDISQLKETEAQLSATNSRLGKLIESMHDGILVEDENQQIILVNQNFCDHLGLDSPAAELVGQSHEQVLEQIACREMDAFMHRIKQLEAEKAACFGEVFSLRNGRILERDYIPIVVAGQFRGQMWQYGDITQRKQMEVELFNQKERLLVTLDSINEGVIATDDKSRIEYLNPVAEQLTGWQESHARLQHLSRVFPIIDEDKQQALPDFSRQILEATQAFHQQRHIALVNAAKQQYSIEISAAPICDHTGKRTGSVIVFRDVSKAREMETQMRWQATHDVLTGLANRRQFENTLNKLLEDAKLHQHQHILLYLDLDQFKIINDTSGHRAGDALLTQLATLLQAQIQENDLLARLGGDEFGVLLHDQDLNSAYEIAERLRSVVSSLRFDWQGKIYTIGVSIGMTQIHTLSGAPEDVMSMADIACYAAKEQGRNRIHIHEANDQKVLQHQGEMRWTNRIRHALEAQQFELYAQAIKPLTSSVTTTETAGLHVEILLRLHDETDGIICPDTFIPAAERYNLMHLIDRWVLNSVFKQLSPFCKMNATHPVLDVCAINLSGDSLGDENLLSYIQELFTLYSLPPEKICFEITETVAVSNLVKATHFITKLREMGCRFALDDFGTGLSSFAYLKQLPVDYLKIDGSFVQDILKDESDHAIVEAINDIGQTLGLKTIAEFVESPEIEARLQAMGLDYAQGYGIERPMALSTWLKKNFPS
ncbi:bifunctional diguanylate cyclase/phosphodiesterase [Candidatus Venteria ishoeyi]|nr:bifunctional diguanylate cyclase/phosphodiesterase [Candidatus Venteria ishoeyi]MDM8546402.1 EAL domain-containing protein [Candidatus Venteria ishoeyi]